MRTTNVAMYSPNSTEPITFSLGDKLSSEQYLIRGIVGLDAEEITPKFYGFGSVSKSRFYNFGLKARDIVMRIVLRPRFNLGESYSDIRDNLYRVISANRSGLVTLHFNADATNVARVQGFITKFEAGYFNKEPEVQITIRCDDPLLRAINPVHIEPDDIEGLPALDYPNVNISDTRSTAPHGFVMKINFKGTTKNFIMQDDPINPDWFFRIKHPDDDLLVEDFRAGDVLYFSSETSNKYLYMTRAGATYHLIDRILAGSVWPIIFPGENKFFFLEPATFDWEYFEYYPAYWGV